MRMKWKSVFRQDMDEVDVDVCGLCLHKDDPSSEEFVDWVECQLCGIWYHETCVFFDQSSNVDFICHICDS